MITLLHGDESFLIEEALAKVRRENPRHDVTRLGGKTELGKVSELGATMGLFSTNKLIILEDPWFLSGKLADADAEKLEELLKEFQASPSILAITLESKMDQRLKSASLMKKYATIQLFEPFKDWEQAKVVDWINTRLRGLEKSITMAGAESLVATCGVDLRRLSQEINTLITYVGDRDTLDVADIKAMHGGQAVTLFDLQDILQSANASALVNTVVQLLDNNEDAVAILGFLAAQMRLYHQILVLLSQNQGFDAIGSATGKNPYYIKRLIPPLKKGYSVDRLAQNLISLNKTDIAIKSGQMKPNEAILLCVSTMV